MKRHNQQELALKSIKTCVASSIFALTAYTGTCAYAAQSAAPAAGAPEAGFYIGARVGRSRADGCDRLFAVGFSGNCDNKNTALSVFAGYQVNRHFAAELGYGSGELNVNGALGGVPYVASVETRIFELTGLAMLPVMPNLSVYARGGLFHWDTDAEANFGGLRRAGNDSDIDLTYGLGAQYSFTRNWSARVEWQRYRDIGSASALGKADADIARAAVRYAF